MQKPTLKNGGTHDINYLSYIPKKSNEARFKVNTNYSIFKEEQKNMKYKTIAALVIGAFLFTGNTLMAGSDADSTSNGITFPEDYKDWRVISSSFRKDNNTMRVIVGNDIAVMAARKGAFTPWPEGATLGKLIWKNSVDPDWEDAIVPGAFVHSEFMVKDSVKYKETGGWGYARWVGMEKKPLQGSQGCFSCHTAVKGNDYVFTHPAILP